MTINNNSTEQINIALLDIDSKINTANKNIKSIVNTVNNLNNTTSSVDGIVEGKTYNIDISGTAAYADTAETSATANALTNTISVQTTDTISDTAISWKGNTDLTIPFKKLTESAAVKTTTKFVGTNDDEKLFSYSLEYISRVIFDKVYPIGSIYTSTKETSPEELFKIGTWERIKDTFLLAAGDSYVANTTGGSATKTLESDNLPSHSHSYIPAGNIISTFTGTTRSFTATGGNHCHNAGNNHGLGFSVDIPHNGAHASGSYGSYVKNTSYSGNLTVSGAFTPSGSVSSIFIGSNLATEVTGSGKAFDTLPPYLTVYVWKRTA